MTSPSDQKTTKTNDKADLDKALAQQAVLTQKVNKALDNSVAQMSSETSVQLSNIRQAALRHAKHKVKRAKPGLFKEMKLNPFFQLSLPVAAAVLVVVSLNKYSNETIPALPLAMTTSQMPAEDLALLKDLEFVTWLAENEQEISL